MHGIIWSCVAVVCGRPEIWVVRVLATDSLELGKIKAVRKRSGTPDQLSWLSNSLFLTVIIG